MSKPRFTGQKTLKERIRDLVDRASPDGISSGDVKDALSYSGNPSVVSRELSNGVRDGLFVRNADGSYRLA